ncbi:asparagine synthase (glutamine-hydrolyzing) [Teredinibacter sp. KSP-S5-2]|uniref:asparagine synthase (glutamine-hydrolyzing) n=1 Tax=Teredinibacter sp. KSP-S5-2 TaxID=3034506 RepID=UPI0029349BC5|nr:asparagine synthase (glutamine-hydrolyzing) [Teredinibacter sp. KSP-S5-2]WNO08515.1 asparagine synthase (glutamine-hydrolyzing) [Teredinibacter sp. KSP-S5-2]
MCGIAGVIANSKLDIECEATAISMANSLYHRGPDGAGYYSDESALLVHTRLSIIDLHSGDQPIHNEDKSVWIVFNGEIYNYIELREALIHKGHRFYTKSDTEVIVHLYDEYGTDFIHYLNGQFAICLWDKNKRKAILARDRVGIAPLYFTLKQDHLIFASEIKAILSTGNTPPSLNVNALDQLLTFWAPVSPNTIFNDIYELPPGEMAVYQNGRLEKNTYWDMDFPEKGQHTNISEKEACEKIHDLLVDATQIRLRSDVPVATYLSGGLDSSILASCINKFSDTKLTTFSLTFADKNMDESQYQQQLVEQLNTDHRSIACHEPDIAKHFLSSIQHIESPIIRTAPIPMGMLSSLVKENHYKVVLTGEGADEIFGGYDLFKETKLRQFWSRQPDSTWRPRLIQRLYPYLNLAQGKANIYLQNFFGGGVEQPDHPLFSHMPRWLSTSKIKQFYSPRTKENLSEQAEKQLINRLPTKFESWPSFNKAQYLEVKTLMGGYLLSSQGDRMLMKNSIEGRFPFLDHRLIEFTNQLDPRLKMKVLNEKYILKRAMGKYLPDAITNRYKQPYRAPNIPSFFGEHSPEFVDELLDQSKVDGYGYFDGKKVAMLVKKIKSGRSIGQKDNMALVAILSTQAWHHLFIDNTRTVLSEKQQFTQVKRIN